MDYFSRTTLDPNVAGKTTVERGGDFDFCVPVPCGAFLFDQLNNQVAARNIFGLKNKIRIHPEKILTFFEKKIQFFKKCVPDFPFLFKNIFTQIYQVKKMSSH